MTTDFPVTVPAEIVDYSLNVELLVICSAFVVLIQAGFLFLECGRVRAGSVQKILTRRSIDVCLTIILYWLLGHGFLFGKGGFMGTTGFATSDYEGSNHAFSKRPYDGYMYSLFVVRIGYAMTVTAIVSGAVAERCHLVPYFISSAVTVTFTYPIAAHWVWSPNGWASGSALRPVADRLFDVGVIDVAGGSVIHLIGGVTALVASLVLGPRIRRFGKAGNSKPVEMKNAAYATLGVVTLWFGWVAMHCASVGSMKGVMSDVVGKTAASTFFGGLFGGFSTSFLIYVLEEKMYITHTANGVLTGVVSCACGCSVFQVETNLVVGMLAGILYYVTSWLMEKLHIDDVTGSIAIHLSGGLIGTLMVGIFAHPDNVNSLYGTDACGVVYGCAKRWEQLAAQFVICIVVILWAAGFAVVEFGAMMYLKKLRVSSEEEIEDLPEFAEYKPTMEQMRRVLERSMLGLVFEEYRNPVGMMDADKERSYSRKMSNFIKNITGKNAVETDDADEAKLI